MMPLALAVWTIDAILNLHAPSEPRISPDGRQCAYGSRGEIMTVPVSGGAAKAVGKGSRPRWSPDSSKLAYLSGGTIHVAARTVSAAGPVTAFEWMPDGQGFAAIVADPRPTADPEVSNRDYRFARLWLLPLSGQPRAVSPADRHALSFAISPDGRRAVYAAQPTPRNRDTFHVDLFSVDLASGAESALVKQDGRDAEPSFSPDGKLVAFHSQAGSLNYFEARHVALVPAGGGTPRYLTAKSRLDVFRNGNSFAWSPDSRFLTFTAGRGVTDVIVRFDVQSGAETILAENVSGAPSVANDGQTAVFLRTSPERPHEVFALVNGKERRLTETPVEIQRLPKPKSEVVRWKSSDGLEVEGVLWLPPDYAPGRRVPLLTELHGGPTGVATRSFPIPRVYPTQMFLDRGVAVFAPNFRGSANYGAAFRLRNTLSQGVGDFADVMTGIDALVARGIADPERLGVMGWSYGGYLTAATITQTQRFRAASVGAPATDWITYYGQSDGPREVLWTYFGGKPWDVPENYRKHSPRAKLHLVRTPTLLQVGGNDINHNAEIFQALTDSGVEVEYAVYPREGHGIREPAHVRDLLERNLRWFGRLFPVRP